MDALLRSEVKLCSFDFAKVAHSTHLDYKALNA